MEQFNFNIDPYAVLGVPRNADLKTIREAYHKKARELHPDRHPGVADGGERFKEVQEAYEILTDPLKKQVYDLAVGGVAKILLCIVCTFGIAAVLRATEILPIPWLVVFTPVWLINMCMLPVACFMITQENHFYDGLTFALFVLFTVLLYLKVADYIETWLTVVFPFIAIDFVTFFTKPASSENESACGGAFTLIANGVRHTARSIFLILAARKLDGVSDLTWWVIFLPLFCRYVCSSAKEQFANSDYSVFEAALYITAISSPYLVLGSVIGSCNIPVAYSVSLLLVSCCVFQYRFQSEGSDDRTTEQLFTDKPGHVSVDIPKREKHEAALSDVD